MGKVWSLDFLGNQVLPSDLFQGFFSDFSNLFWIRVFTFRVWGDIILRKFSEPMGVPGRCNPAQRTASDLDIQWTGMRMAVPCGSEITNDSWDFLENEEKLLLKAVKCWREQQKL